MLAKYASTYLMVVGLVLVPSDTQAALIPHPTTNPGNGLTYIGSLRNLNPATGAYRRSAYYLSVNDASWEDAQKDCGVYLGENGTLLYLQTETEFNQFIDWYHDTIGPVRNYWTGGLWRNNRFEWADGTPIGTWLSWDVGQPETQFPITRIEFRPLPKAFATEFDSSNSRYICEVDIGGGGNPDPCYVDNDLIIVVDSSGSITPPNYELAKEFTRKLAVAWAGSNERNRVSVITFADTVTTVVGLDANATPEQLETEITNIAYTPGGGTGTDIALDSVRSEFAANPRNVPKNMVMLTDGFSGYPNKTIIAAAKVNDASIRGFAVGITDNVDEAELLVIAGGVQGQVFRHDDFEAVLNLLKSLSEDVCQ